jgi:hypothetical protein
MPSRNCTQAVGPRMDARRLSRDDLRIGESRDAVVPCRGAALRAPSQLRMGCAIHANMPCGAAGLSPRRSG